MIAGNFKAAWPEYFNVVVDVDWTPPFSHAELFSGGVSENESAYFYSIVALSRGEWWPYYIGMTFRQTVATRNGQADHLARIDRLKKAHPRHEFMLTLGTPRFEVGSVTLDIIGAIEGLLIYGNWHPEMDNSKKVQTFSPVQHLFVRNTGWSEHLEPELAYGVFYKGRT